MPLPGLKSLSTRIQSNIAPRLRRVTSSGLFIPEVDGLRFIAIASVVLFHLTSPLVGNSGGGFSPPLGQDPVARILQKGNIGVRLFFVLSGFLLALPFATYHLNQGPPVSLRSYYLRRVTRIEPPYLISLLALFVLLVLQQKAVYPLIPHLLASTFYVHNLVYGDGSTINFVAWSLEVEVQFYLIAPTLALLFGIRSVALRRSLIGSLVLIFTAIRYYCLLKEANRGLLSIFGYGQFFAAGFMLADFYLVSPVRIGKPALYWDIVSFIGWPMFILSLQSEKALFWTQPLFIFTLYLAVFRGAWLKKALSNPLVTSIGGMCYSIYLIHFVVIGSVWKLTGNFRAGNTFSSNFLLQSLLMLPAILLICTGFYLLIEKPCMHTAWPALLVKWAGHKTRKQTKDSEIGTTLRFNK